MDIIEKYENQYEVCDCAWCDSSVTRKVNDALVCEADYEIITTNGNACPECGKLCVYDYVCPTYKTVYNGKETWMSCLTCGNDTEWSCTDLSCGWKRYVDSRNPQYTSTKRPDWFDDKNKARVW